MLQYDKEILISSILTLAVVVYDMLAIKSFRFLWYCLYFALIFFTLLTFRSEASEPGLLVFDDGVIFEAYEEYDAATKPTREWLINKMIEHRKGHDVAMHKSEAVLKNYWLWNSDIEELYRAAFAAVSTYAGCRNYMLPAVVAILEYCCEKGWQGMKVWQAYSTHYYEGQYHAEMFDFYMQVLKKYYHQ